MASLCRVIIVLTLFNNALALINNDHEAYAYCISNNASYIAIVWPLAQGKDHQIEKILHTYGSLKYKKIVYFTYDQARSLLRDAHPHIADMHAHMEWYFPSGTLGKPARIYLMKFASLEIAVKCKHAIRNLFNMGYTSIHINDYHHEVIKLAQFFFNTGSRKYIQHHEKSDSVMPDFLKIYCACLSLSLS